MNRCAAPLSASSAFFSAQPAVCILQASAVVTRKHAIVAAPAVQTGFTQRRFHSVKDPPNGKPHYQHATHVLRHEVIIAIAEAGTGAILKDLHELLLRLEERSNPATDTTHYGNSRVSATSFYQHYARHIGAAVQDAFGVEMLRVEACLGQAWLKRQRVLRDPGLIDDPRPPPKRREPSA